MQVYLGKVLLCRSIWVRCCYAGLLLSVGLKRVVGGEGIGG